MHAYLVAVFFLAIYFGFLDENHIKANFSKTDSRTLRILKKYIFFDNKGSVLESLATA